MSEPVAVPDVSERLRKQEAQIQACLEPWVLASQHYNDLLVVWGQLWSGERGHVVNLTTPELFEVVRLLEGLERVFWNLNKSVEDASLWDLSSHRTGMPVEVIKRVQRDLARLEELLAIAL